ncbi:MAG: ATP-grasp domain-containing protein [Bacillus sp. (in: Bacteria)]|nr:ATP-grasp domain-containing protein [Bacillus sp. (in: firmicutes)]MCM1427817.1 ATP-grasp domain-containing protein [Eubacterium sp.]
MNILILSCGTRNQLIRYFKEQDNGIDKVVGTDCSVYAPALYETDSHYIVPRMTAPDYLDTVLDICRKEKIDAVLPLQEDELYLTASYRQQYTDVGVTPIVSTPETIEICRDKYAFYQHLQKNNLPALTTCKNIAEFQDCYKNAKMDFPIFIKPVRGCGSIGIQKVENMELLSALCKYGAEEMLIQQFANGEEYGVDLYVDMLSHKPISIFIKKKLRMRAGETEKSISVKDDVLFDLVKKTAASLSLSGPVDMDVFKVNGSYYISEINPRFGGGYPHAHACGMNFPSLIANNIEGKENADTSGRYEDGVCMLKYTDLMTLKLNDITIT